MNDILNNGEILEAAFYFVIILVAILGGLLLLTGLEYVLFPSLREEIKRDWKGVDR